MYATNRLPGFELHSASIFGIQSPKVPVKPTPEIQKLLDTAAKLPIVDKFVGYEKALDAAIATKDAAGARFSARELRNVLIALERTNEVEPFLRGLQKRAQQAMFPLMEAHVLVNLGLTYDSAIEFDKAIGAYESASKLFEAGGDKAGQSRAIGNMAKTLSENGKTAEARLAFDRALPLAKKSGDLAQIATVLELAAAMYKDLGDDMKALSLQEESLPIWRELGDKAQVAQTALNIAKHCADRGDLAKALSLYEESQAIWRELGDDLRVDAVQHFIDKIRLARNKIDNELPRLEEALAVQRKRGDIEGIAKSLDNLARFLQDNGDKSTSLLIYEESLTLWRKVGNKRAISARLSDIASIYEGNGNLPKALSYYEESLLSRREIGNKFGIAIGLRNLADCHKTIGDLRKSLRMYQESLPVFREVSDKYFVAETLNDIAEMFDLLGQSEVAIKYRAESAVVNPGRSDPDNIINLLQRPKILRNALKFYEDLLAKLRASGNKSQVAECLREVANVHRAQKNLPKALVYYEEALAIYRALMDKTGIVSSLYDIAIIHHSRNDNVKALAMYKESLVIYRDLKDNSGIAKLLNNIGEIHRFRGDLSNALAMHEESLTLHRMLSDKSGIAKNLGGIGYIYKTRGDFSKALAIYKESLEINKELNDKSGVATVLLEIADIYESSGDLTTALGSYDESLKISKNILDQPGVAVALERIAGIYQTRGDLSKALEMYKESLAIASALGDRYHVAVLQGNIAKLHLENGDLAGALSLCGQSLEVLRELGDKSSIAKCLDIFAAIHEDSGNTYMAIEMFEESLAIHRELADKAGIAASLNNLASCKMDTWEAETALSLFEQSLSLFRELGDRSGIAVVLSNIAQIRSREGNNLKALAIYEESLSVSRLLGDKKVMASTQNSMAIVHKNLGDLVNAIKSSEVSLALSREVGDKGGIATSLSNIALLLDEIGLQSKAVPAREEALRLFEQVRDTKGQAQVIGQIGDSLLSLGDAAGALQWFGKALGLLGPDYGPVHAVTELRIDEAKLALGMKLEDLPAFKRLLIVSIAGQPGGPLTWRFLLALARSYPSGGLTIRYALANAERYGDPVARASVYVAMANVAKKSGDKIIEMTHLQRAVDSLQSLRRGAAGLSEEYTGALRSHFAADYRRLMELLYDSGRPGQAQLVRDLLDKAEQRQLGNILDNKPTRRLSPSEQAYDKVAQELRDLGNRERFLAKVKYPSPEVLVEIRALQNRIKATNDRLLAAFDNVLADARRASVSAVDVSEGLDRVKRMLMGQPPGTAAVSVLCTPKGVRFVVWTSRGVAQRRSIVDEKVLSAKVEAFQEVLVNPLRDPVALARELYSWLWKPIEGLLVEMNVRRVLLHLDGPARYVPYGALHDGKRYVAQRWETSLFSPTLIAGMTDRPSRSWSVLAAGTSGGRTVTDGLGREVKFTALPGVRTEVARVRRAVGAGPEPLLDDMFDVKSLARLLASHPKVVHLASHFVFDAGGESLSFLLMGKGQVLPVSDTTVLTKENFAGVELLTLSACQTGRFSQTRDGMEVEGIAGILRRKGVRAVLSTLWPVADMSSSAFMSTFYGLRAADPSRTKAWCLREAQLQMIRGEVAPPYVRAKSTRSKVTQRGVEVVEVRAGGRYTRNDWSHPYHWAPFILQGNPL